MEKTLNIFFTLLYCFAPKLAYHISLAHPKDGLTKEVIQGVAQKIIDAQCFNSDKHTLVAFKKATYVTREENEIL